MEQTLGIKEVTGKNGKNYKNLNLKDLEVGNHIEIEKTFVEGLKVEGKFGPVFSIGAKYKDEQISFWLNSKQHDRYKSIGGVGDKLTITAKEVKVVNPKTKVKMLIQDYDFALVE